MTTEHFGGGRLESARVKGGRSGAAVGLWGRGCAGLGGWHTTVSLRWVADRLRMGHYTRVTQAVSRVGRKPAKRLVQPCRQLEREVKHA